MVPEEPRGVEACFTGLAGLYAAHRPGYPAAAIAAALEGLPRPARVADVGCGTGISTRLLAAAGATVVGLDPNEDMIRAARSHATPRVRYEMGTAEATGLDRGSVDLVLCAQSFHWFDGDAARSEFARILRPGGRLALLWNVRDPETTLGAAYEAVVAQAQDDARRRGLVVRRFRCASPDTSRWFENARRQRFANPQRLDWPGLAGRIRSASYFPRAGALADDLMNELRAAFDAHQHGGFVDLPQWTELTTATCRPA